MAESQGRIVSVNISSGGIPKRAVEIARAIATGLEGDAHNHEKHNTPMQAISLIDIEDLDDLGREGFQVFPGATGENLTVRDLDVGHLQVGDRLQFSGGVLIELTKVRQPCYVLDSINAQLKTAIKNRCGF